MTRSIARTAALRDAPASMFPLPAFSKVKRQTKSPLTTPAHVFAPTIMTDAAPESATAPAPAPKKRSFFKKAAWQTEEITEGAKEKDLFSHKSSFLDIQAENDRIKRERKAAELERKRREEEEKRNAEEKHDRKRRRISLEDDDDVKPHMSRSGSIARSGRRETKEYVIYHDLGTVEGRLRWLIVLQAQQNSSLTRASQTPRIVSCRKIRHPHTILQHHQTYPVL